MLTYTCDRACLPIKVYIVLPLPYVIMRPMAISKHAQLISCLKRLDFSKITCILLLRLQGLIWYKAAVTVVMKILECNPRLLLFYYRCNVKIVQNLL